MARPDPIQYAERLYGAIRAANFSPISFLTFGNAIKDGVPMRNMARIAAEPFMRVVGEMLDLEEQAAEEDIIDAAIAVPTAATQPTSIAAGAEDIRMRPPCDSDVGGADVQSSGDRVEPPPTGTKRKHGK